jgi:hypothetical protein
MSGRIFVAPHHSTEELERRYKAANDGIERGHLHIIWLLIPTAADYFHYPGWNAVEKPASHWN